MNRLMVGTRIETGLDPYIPESSLVAGRAFSGSARQMKNNVPEAQKLFQADNGLPVHVKGGTTDVLLYRATMTLTIAGTGYSLYWLLVAAMPQKKA